MDNDIILVDGNNKPKIILNGEELIDIIKEIELVPISRGSSFTNELHIKYNDNVDSNFSEQIEKCNSLVFKNDLEQEYYIFTNLKLIEKIENTFIFLFGNMSKTSKLDLTLDK